MCGVSPSVSLSPPSASCVEDVKECVGPLLSHVTTVRAISNIRSSLHSLLSQVLTGTLCCSYRHGRGNRTEPHPPRDRACERHTAERKGRDYLCDKESYVYCTAEELLPGRLTL